MEIRGDLFVEQRFRLLVGGSQLQAFGIELAPQRKSAGEAELFAKDHNLPMHRADLLDRQSAVFVLDRALSAAGLPRVGRNELLHQFGQIGGGRPVFAQIGNRVMHRAQRFRLLGGQR